MLIIKTITHETIWGGQKLVPYSDGSTQKVGHLYSLVSNGEMESTILNGNYKGQTFKKYFDENKQKFGLENYTIFPIALALVEAKDDLSIQVHPNDKMAQEVEKRPFGKNESWYFIETPLNGKIYNGCKCASIEELKEKVKNNKIDETLDYLDVKKDDYVYVEAGTIHAMAAGSLVYEIEENCNLTYRVYDFDRKDKNGNSRELHLDKALKAIDVSLKSKAKQYENKPIQERFYTTQLYENTEIYTNKTKTIECLTIIDGKIKLSGEKIQTGTTIVLEPNEKLKTKNIKFMVARVQIKGVCK